MNFAAVTTKLAFIGVAGLSLAGCLSNSRPDTAFPNTINVSPPRGGAPVAITGRVEAERVGVSTLERRVVLTANGTEIGRATLPDARLADAANRPAAINGEIQGVAFSANCGNRETREPDGERRGILHRLTFAEITCQVTYAGRQAGTLTMLHAPRGSVIEPAAVSAAAR